MEFRQIRKHLEARNFIIDECEGHMPVQIGGLLPNGSRFYFRARGHRICLMVNEYENTMNCNDMPEWWNAGLMSEQEAFETFKLMLVMWETKRRDMIREWAEHRAEDISVLRRAEPSAKK